MSETKMPSAVRAEEVGNKAAARILYLARSLQSVLDAMGCGECGGNYVARLRDAKSALYNHALGVAADSICDELSRLIFIIRNAEKCTIDGVESVMFETRMHD